MKVRTKLYLALLLAALIAGMLIGCDQDRPSSGDPGLQIDAGVNIHLASVDLTPTRQQNRTPDGLHLAAAWDFPVEIPEPNGHAGGIGRPSEEVRPLLLAVLLDYSISIQRYGLHVPRADPRRRYRRGSALGTTALPPASHRCDARGARLGEGPYHAEVQKKRKPESRVDPRASLAENRNRVSPRCTRSDPTPPACAWRGSQTQTTHGLPCPVFHLCHLTTSMATGSDKSGLRSPWWS